MAGKPMNASQRLYQPAAHILALPPYTPIEPFEVLSKRLQRAPEDIIKLDANENPYGPSPKVLRALSEMPFAHIYPDPESRALRAALADFTRVPEENLLAGSGADELIDLIMRVLLEPQDRVLICPPTFGMYAFDTRLNAGQLVEAWRRPDFSLDLMAVRKMIHETTPKLLFLATPNNPDGSMIPDDVLDELLQLPLIVILDEAYIEFSGRGNLGQDASRLRQVSLRDNLIVLRTFSKWAGLAGLRVGYGAFPTWLMPVLWKAKQPYNVNVAASTAAIASLQDADYLAEIVARLRRERENLLKELLQIPYLQPYPSHSNFILNKVMGRDALGLKTYLATQHGILLRYFDSPGLRDHIRISVGRPDQTHVLLQALKKW
jgi:histidinol-phosphate aminotransferase